MPEIKLLNEYSHLLLKHRDQINQITQFFCEACAGIIGYPRYKDIHIVYSWPQEAKQPEQHVPTDAQ